MDFDGLQNMTGFKEPQIKQLSDVELCVLKAIVLLDEAQMKMRQPEIFDQDHDVVIHFNRVLRNMRLELKDIGGELDELRKRETHYYNLDKPKKPIPEKLKLDRTTLQKLKELQRKE